MAEWTSRCNGTYGSHYTIKLTASEGTYSVQNNTTPVTITLSIKADTYYEYHGYTSYGTIFVDGSSQGQESTGSQISTSWVTLSSKTVTITHNSDGSKSIYVSAAFDTNYPKLSYSDIGGTFTLTKHDRYFTSTPTLTYNSATETTMNFSWSTSETCSQAVLYRDGTAVQTKSVNATSGSFDAVTGLSAGINYQWFVRCTRKDSGLSSDSDKQTKATYPYPSISSVAVDGTNMEFALPVPGTNITQTVTLNNPLNRTNITVYAKKDNTSGTLFGSASNTLQTTGSVSLQLITNTMYSAIPNSTSGTIVYYCVYNDGTAHTSATVAGTFKTLEANCKPTIASGLVPTYTNTNATHAALVGNNTIIQGQSSFSITSPTITTKGSATVKFYYFRIGAGDYEVSSVATKNYASTTASDNVTIYCYAQDSRGYYSETRSATMRVLAYSPPTATIEAKRNGYTTSGYVKVSATRSFLSTSSATSTDVNAWTGDNSVHKVSLSISPSDAQLASSVIGTTGVSFTNAEVSISLLNKEKGYFVDVAISDKITTTLVKTVVIDKATPILSMNARSSCVSINAIADDNSTNKFEVHGNTYLEGNSILGNPNTDPGSTQSWNNVYLREGANLSVDEGYGRFILGTKGAFISDDDSFNNYFKLFQFTLPQSIPMDGDQYNEYIQFDVVQKNKRIGHIKLTFAPTDWQDPPPGINGDWMIGEFTKTGNIIAMISQPDTFGRSYFYIRKQNTQVEDYVDIINFNKGVGLDDISVVWMNTCEYIDEDDTFEMMDKVFASEENSTFLGAYPIHSIYISTDSTNPMYKFGGSWVRFANGRTLVGVDENDTDFSTVNKTAGSKAMQKHSHTRGTMNITGSYTIADDSDSASFDAMTYGSGAISAKNGAGYASTAGSGGGTWMVAKGFDFDAANNWTGSTSEEGTGTSGNLQPYITVYMWERTA